MAAQKRGRFDRAAHFCKKCGKKEPEVSFTWRSDAATMKSYCRGCQKVLSAKGYPEQRKRARERYWLKTYGLTSADVEALLDKQGGGCAICGSRTWPEWGKPVVDHDHATGEVRGLLCVSCNAGVGQLRDDPELLRKALEYLLRKRGA